MITSMDETQKPPSERDHDPLNPPRPMRRKGKRNHSSSSKRDPRESLKTYLDTEATPSTSQAIAMDNKENEEEPSEKVESKSRSSSQKSNGSATPVRPPPPVPDKKTVRRIKTFDNLNEIAQKATEYNNNAEKDMENNNYMKAAKKYERCLNYIDDVLETPLRRLNLSPADETTAAEVMQEMKLLRKAALQGFMDSQTSHTYPQVKRDTPPDAPPSYNDVLHADLLESNSQAITGQTPLEPKQIPVTSKLIDLSVVESQTKTESQVKNKDETKPVVSVRPKQFKTPKPVMPKQRSNSKNRNIEMPPDVVLRNISKRENVVTRNKRTTESKNASEFTSLVNSSVDSTFSDASFVTAFSSPAPRASVTDDVFDSMSTNPDSMSPVIDPFSFEDPFQNDEFKAENMSTIFPEEDTSFSSHKSLSRNISFLPDTPYYSEVVKKKNRNPFEDSFSLEKSHEFSLSTNKKYSKPIDAQKAQGNDQFKLLNEEFRKKFVLPANKTDKKNSVDDSIISKKSEPVSIKTYSDDHDNSIYMNTLDLDTSQLSTLSRKSRHYQSDINLATLSRPKQKSPRNKKLMKTKGLSRSNESVLLMFDPCMAEGNSDNDLNVDNYQDELCPQQNSSMNNPIYGTMEEPEPRINHNGESMLVMIDDLNKDESAVKKETYLNENTKSPSRSPNTTSTEPKVISTNEIRKSLYPKLPVDDNLSNRPLPPIPVKKIKSPPPIPRSPKNYKPEIVGTSSTTKDVETIVNNNKDSSPVTDNRVEPTNVNLAFAVPVFDGNQLSFKEVIDKGHKVEVGKSSFYKSSSIEEEETPALSSATSSAVLPSSSTVPPSPPADLPSPSNVRPSPPTDLPSTSNVRPSPPTVRPSPPTVHPSSSDQAAPPISLEITKSVDEPCPPPRTSSRRRSSTSWQDVFHVQEAVKLFFLRDSDVSAPFNRQSLAVYRKDWVNSVDNQGEGRVEIGGELFVLELQGKTTMVMQDHHGDYIIHSPAGVYLCISPCYPMKKNHLFALEKVFEIYANFAKEQQGVRLPGEMEFASENVRKTVNSVKNNSIRAIRRIRGAIGIPTETETKQELSSEFLPLKKACERFRQARFTKTVRYF